MNAREAMERLRAGNARYLEQGCWRGDVSPERRRTTWLNGQKPWAIVVTCSDSRVIPEAIFDAGIGELFVIRVAGNVMDDHQLGSIEYAADHLGTPLVLVLGHTHCGAVEAAMHHDPSGYIKFITDEIRRGIGDATDAGEACRRNVRHSVAVIESSLEIRREESERGLRVIGGVYRIEDGRVTFLED